MRLPMHASSLQAIRLSVANLAAARHFWESALGFQCTGECEVDDATLRRLWDTEGGAMRAARLERSGSSRIELYQWEGCTGQPIRNPHRPWDLGVTELQLQCVAPEKVLAALAGKGCEMLRDGVFVTPFGERCRLVSSSDEAVVLSVNSLEECDAFFGGFLGWNSRQRRALPGQVAGAASVAGIEAAMFCSNGGGAGSVEAGCFRRTADPRAARETASRMSPAFTGVWMLTASTESFEASAEAVEVDVPFVGRRRAVVTRAPGGVRFGVFSTTAG